MDQLAGAGLFHEQRAAAAAERHAQESHRQLFKIIKTKCTTGFIGAINAVEELIGKELWGHGKPLRDCTDEQRKWRSQWEACRSRILDNGNRQVRALESEGIQYSVVWNRYETKLKVEGDRNGNH